ncbi:MAG: radical SAM protein [Candidatus Eisenbacteria bacterium]
MMRIRSLFLKPTLGCTADCIHCKSRMGFYRSLKGDRLTLGEHLETIREARSLGARTLHLSGGEPTLYPNLARLVEEGKRVGMMVILNTNGSRMDEALARRLLSAGLDSAIVSLHSAREEAHDEIKRRRGSHREVLRCLRVLRRLRDEEYSRFLLTTQTIVSKRNFRELPDLLDSVCRLEVDGHGISYVEGDSDGSLLLNADEVEELRRTVLPKARRRLREHTFKNPILRHAALRLLANLYRTGYGPDESGRGVVPHGSPDRGRCRTPLVFVMVLSEGSVLPCNMAEYSGGPILGNVRETGLRSIVESERWRRFAREGHELCLSCPAHLHFHIPISIGMRALIRLALGNPAEEQKSILRRIGEVLGYARAGTRVIPGPAGPRATHTAEREG